MKKLLLLMLFLLSFVFVPDSLSAQETEGQASLIVKASSQSLHQTVLKIKSEKLVQALFRAKPLETVKDIPFSNHFVLLEDRGTIRIYSVDENGHFYDVQQKKKLQLSPSAAKKINSYLAGLQQHHFGTLQTWEEIDQIIPRYTTFTVLDLDSGFRFRAQRRAGNNHADVQPLTKSDTAIMKKIYGGKWSWKRRAILLLHDGHALAASMHGMPHGGGALANGFPGHFCIHFVKIRIIYLWHELFMHE
jgi:hypothetical protein